MKKAMTLLVAAIIVFSMFSGCNKKEGSSKSSSESNTAQNLPAADFGGKKIKIASWSTYAQPRLGISDYEDATYYAYKYAEERNNAKIEWVIVPYADYANKFTQSSLSGTTFADILTVHSDYHASWINQGLLQDITSFMKNEDKEKYNLNISKFKNKIYGVDVNSAFSWPYQFLVFNKDLLTSLNLTSPVDLQIKGQWTWDKLREYCKTATKDTTGDGIIDQFGISSFGFPDQVRQTNNALQYVSDNNGKYFNANTYASTKQRVLNSLNFVADMATKDRSVMGVQSGGLDAKDAMVTAFKNNKLLFASCDLNLTRDLKSQGVNNFVPVLFPKGPDNDKYEFVMQGYSFRAIASQTDYELKDLVTFCKDATNTWDKTRGDAYYYPLEDSEVVRVADEFFCSQDDAQKLFDMSKNIKTTSTLYGSLDIGSIEVWEIWQPILEGKSTPAAVIGSTDGKIQAAIDKVLNK